MRPLAGFCGLFADCKHESIDQDVVSGWVNKLARNAVACSAGREPRTVNKGKGFDDPIDSGLAALTCVAFAVGESHLFGDGTDGAIVGPGVLS